MDTAQLLERCRRGDELAWEALVRTYQSRIYGLALHYVRDADSARDLAQEIFVRIYRRLDTFRGHETFLPWMLRLARNACIDHLRRLKARPPRSDVRVEDGPELAGSDGGPHVSWERDHQRRLVHRALENMGEQSREMIILKDIQGLNLQEVADLLEIPLGTAKSRSSRARLELARTILKLEPAYGYGTAV